MAKDNSIHDIIDQLISVTDHDLNNIREKRIKNLTPIQDVSEGPTPPHDPEFSFMVSKKTPKESKFSFDDAMTIIESEELYRHYLELPKDEFIKRINKTLYDHISAKLEEAKDNNVPDENNIWMQPNAAFVNWFQENGIDIDPLYLFTN